MKNIDRQLERLLKSAAKAHATSLPAEEPSAALENRVIAAWRAGLVTDDTFSWSLLVFRRGLAFACVVVMLIFAWSYNDLREQPADETFLAEVEMQLTLLP